MSPDASVLLDWMTGRSGDVTTRDFEAAPRRFRRAAVYGPLVAELLAAGAIVSIGDRPRTYSILKASAPTAAPSASGSGAKLRAMLEDAAAELDDVPAELASYAAAVAVRDRLVASLLASNGLPTDGDHARAARAVDAAVFRAFGHEVPA